MPIKQMFDTALTDVWAATDVHIGDSPGDVRWEGNRAYKCVIYAGTIVAGNAVKYADLAGYNAHTVRESTSLVEPVAGLPQAAAVSGQRGWIQIKGPATTAIAVTGTPSVGDAISASATTGALGIWASPRQVSGLSLDGTTGVVLDCPL